MKSFLRGFVILLLTAGLIGFALSASLQGTFGTPDQIKQSLEEAGLYENLSDDLADATLAAAEEEGLDLPEPEVRQAAEAAFTPQLLQDSAEDLADGVYNWLQGRVQQPDFRIDLTEAKTEFANKLGELAAESIDGLPECTLAELQRMRGMDPAEAVFTLECRPPGFDSSDAEAQVAQMVSESEQFLPEPVITADTLPRDQQGRTVFEQFSDAPDKFQSASSTSWILGLITILLAGALVLLSSPRVRGLRVLGIVLFIAGILMAVAQVIMVAAANTAARSANLGQDLSNLNPVLTGVVESLSAAYGGNLLRYGIMYILTGLLLLGLYLAVSKRRVQKEQIS